MRLSGVATLVRRWLPVAAALALLTLTPTFPAGFSSRGFARDRARGNPRPLGPQNVARLNRIDHRARPHRARARVQHAPRAGQRPRRRVLHEQPRTTRRRSPATPHELRPAGHRPRPGARGRAARARVGERQPRLERRGPAERTDAHRPPSPRVADGAARPRAGTVARPGREPGVCRQAVALDARANDRGCRRDQLPAGARQPTESRRPLHVAPRARGCRSHQRGRPRPRDPLRGRRRPSGLRALPDGTVRLQPRRHSRVPRRDPATTRRGREPRGRRTGSRRSPGLSRHVPDGVEGISHLTPDRRSSAASGRR